MSKVKTVNSLSGGKTSSMMAMKFPADYEVFSLVCIDDPDCRPTDPSIINYVNSKIERFIPEFGEFIATAEDDKVLFAMRDLEQILGREIIWVRGMSFDDVIDTGTQTRLPSWARRYCTEKMKLLPIFLWWFNAIGEKCKMRIGFRFDEFNRIENFFNNSDPTNFSIPVNCRTYGKKSRQHQTFNWRFVTFPLAQNGTIKQTVEDYWEENGTIAGDLFNEPRKIDFPVESNCVGCFHKDVETLAAMATLQLSKIKWFAKQENKNMGTWLDSRLTYQQIIIDKDSLVKERLFEITKLKQSCDSGGCTA